MRQIPFAVVGGFLGAGKTTLVNRVLAGNAGIRYAVLVNDFGKIDIDTSLIRAHDGQTIALSNGCICCSMVNGFVQAMVDLMQRPEPIDRILVEASGVSEPRRIMDFARIDQELVPCRVVVLVDAARFPSQLADPLLADLVARQVEQADLVHVNKVDLAGPDRVNEIVDLLATLAGRVEITVGANAGLDVDGLFRTAAETSCPAAPSAVPVPLGFHSMQLSCVDPIDHDLFQAFCAALGSDVIRGKGILRLSGKVGAWWTWQRVGDRSQLTPHDGPDQDRSRLVLIAKRAEALPGPEQLKRYFPSTKGRLRAG